MTTIKLRKLIREEVRRALKESVLKDIKVSTSNFDFPTSKLKKIHGSYLTIKQGPTKTQNDFEYIADLDVDALISLLKSNKDYQTLPVDQNYNTISVYYKKGDDLAIDAKGLPKEVITTLETVGKREMFKDTVSIQIGDPADNFEDYDSFQLPKVIQSLVGEPTFSPEAEDDMDVYDEEIGKYVRKIEKLLLAAGKKVVPGMKKYAVEDGAIIFELPQQLTAQIKAKLTALYQGAKSVEF